jgi:hypothetical protein
MDEVDHNLRIMLSKNAYQKPKPLGYIYSLIFRLQELGPRHNWHISFYGQTSRAVFLSHPRHRFRTRANKYHASIRNLLGKARIFTKESVPGNNGVGVQPFVDTNNLIFDLGIASYGYVW